MSTVDLQKVTELVREAAGIFFERGEAAKVHAKGAADFVTEVDFHVQEFLQRKLKEAYPELEMMGEEKDNKDLDVHGSYWILDPVDGTTNLIHDLEHSVISLGLCEKGELTLGIIYDPYRDDMYCAKRGEGAFCNGKPIHVTDVDKMEDALVAFGTCPYDKKAADRTFDLVKKVFMDCQDLRRFGSAALELTYVATGKVDLFFEMDLKPWDIAAGTVIVREAGGSVLNFEGETPFPWNRTNVVASNGKIGPLFCSNYMN